MLGSCGKFYLDGIGIFITFFYIWTCKYFYYCYRIYIYICKKHCHLLCWVYKKNNYLLSFDCSIFHSKIFISILHVKWTVMNKGEQVENLKFWANILFEWLQSLLAATKIYNLILNLTHSLISLMGSFHFPNGKYFSQFIDKFLKF